MWQASKEADAMTRRMPVAAQFVVLSMVLVLGWPDSNLYSQELVGAITGQVVDEADNVLPGARIFTTNLQSARITTAYTDGSGTYLTELEPGIYSVRFEVPGFAGVEVPRIEIRLGRTLVLGATLRVGSMTETVEVTAENMRLVDQGGTIVGRNVTVEELDRLPKARSFQSIALMAPFVNEGDIEGGIQVNGASGAENVFTVDGLSTTSVINGSSRQNAAFEYIQEVQIKTTGLAAEFSGALGGVISAVTKSGGNIFSGEVHYHFGGSPLSAAPVRRLVLNPTDDRTVAYIQDEKQLELRHEIGGSLGGPFVRNRLFFFGSFTPSFQRRTENYLFSSGVDEGDITRTSSWIQAFGKLSQSSGRTNVDVTALITPVSVFGSLPAPNGFGANWISSGKSANEANRDRGWRQVQMHVTAKADVVVSDDALVTFRGGSFHDSYSDRGIPDVTSYAYQTVASAALGLPANIQGPTGIRNAPRALITAFDATQRFQVNADYTQRFEGIGRHTLKGGVGYQHSRNDINSMHPGGYVDIFWGIPAIVPGQVADRGTYGYYTVNNRGTFGKAGAAVISLYVQDLWQVANRLTLNIGVRGEDEKVPAYRTDLQKYVVAFPFSARMAPRLGFNYDVSGDGRVKLYASWGRYIDWTKYDMSRSLFGGEIWCTYYRAIDDPHHPVNASLTNMPGRDLWKGAGSCRDRLVPQFDTLDPNIRPMSQESTSAGLDFAVASHTIATVHYIRNRLLRAIEDLGALVDGSQKYLIANPGEGLARTTPAIFAPLTPPFSTPKPMRQYDGLELGVSRRLANNWFGGASLTISRLHGNYGGLASSDEIHTATTGVSSATAQQQAGSIFRQGGNLNRAWDSDEQMFDAYGNLDPVGRLATDRPVVLKVYGAYNIARNTQVGAFVYAGSGTPITTYVVTTNQTETMVNGRGDLGRTPFYSKTDLLVSHEVAMSGNKRLRLELNVLNLFNQKTARHMFNYLNRGAGSPRASAAINLGNTNLFNGYDYNALILASTEGAGAYDPRYQMEDLFEPGTQGQVSVKFLF
jgi:hypothetical protein